ncbi:MAG: chemotaxis protein CheA [Psychromonas sp.]|nr:chemotaxis protein CheA [Psychromonas sp.]
MRDNMQQFDQVFFEEMTDHLEEMESLLLEMSEDDDNLDALNAIFRAAHSIKGGAGIFGYDDISSVTHILENVLDRLRNNELVLTKAMIDAFLDARDVLALLKNSHQFDDEESVPDSRVTGICDQLKCLALDLQDEGAVESSASLSEILSKKEINHVDELTVVEKAKIKILLVEDSKVNQMVANHTLKKLGFENISVAEDGKETLDKLNASLDVPFDLILLDCQMPIMDGYQATQAIRLGRAGDPHVNITIIAMTAMAGDAEKEKCLNVGMDDYLLKPINGPMLDEKISFWYGKISQQDTQGNEAKKTDRVSKMKKPRPSKVIKQRVRKNDSASSIRVNIEKIDQLINQVGELIITQSMLQQLALDFGLEDNLMFVARLSQLETNTRDIQASVMSVRMMPISTVFGRFPRVIRDLSAQLNKKIKLVIKGEQTELDKGLIEILADPLTHLIRNSIDHGIEMPDVRIAKNKDPQGEIEISALYRGDDIVINVKDDGAGIDAHKIRQKALKNGLTLPDQMTDTEIFQLIFSPGFSTATVVTNVSGRGVGMDVVKRNITDMGGRVEISSELGKGSTMSIYLPLTLAILEGMSVSVGEHVYIIPLTYIVESLQPTAGNIKELNGGALMVNVHGEYIPVLILYKFFNIKTDITKVTEGIMILLEHKSKLIALFVDSLIGQQQVVLKNLEKNFRKVSCVSGATIMGDGRISLILNVAELVNQC